MIRISTPTVAVALKITAVVNVVAALGALLAPGVNASLFLGPDVVMEGLLLRHHVLVWSTVLAMGLGYAIASRDPEGQTGLLVAAGFGKLSVAVVWLEMVFGGLGAVTLLGGVVFDGVFGLLFLGYVWQQWRA